MSVEDTKRIQEYLERIISLQLQTPITSTSRPKAEATTSTFYLQTIPQTNMQTEVEFIYPIRKTSSSKITSLLDQIPLSCPKNQQILPVPKSFLQDIQKGFFKGFVDLMFHHKGYFYLLDWKSNFLGHSYQDYQLECLEREMQQSHYLLQGMMYLLALHRYLKKHVPQYDYHMHFGGIFYVFIRGLRPIPSSTDPSPFSATNGIYHMLPPASLMQSMEQTLLDG